MVERGSAITTIAATTVASSTPNKGETMPKTDMAVASAATLVETQWVEAAEAMGAERDHLVMSVLMMISLLLLLQLPQLTHLTLIVIHLLFPFERDQNQLMLSSKK
jgi:ABC-type methionine transport system permease subunit